MQGSWRRPSSTSRPMLKRLERRPNKPVAVAIQRGPVLGGDCEGGWDDLGPQILEPERVPLDQSAKTYTPFFCHRRQLHSLKLLIWKAVAARETV